MEDQLAHFMKMMDSVEPLDPELQKHLVVDDAFGWESISHPLVQSMIHSPLVNKQVNGQLAHKRKLLVEAEAKKDFLSYVFLHERPWRAHALSDIAHKEMPPKKWWQLVSSTWIDAEWVWVNRQFWSLIFKMKTPERQWMMDAKERKWLEARKDSGPLRIWRGSVASSKRGFSWTVDEKKAEWFARRHREFSDTDAAVWETEVEHRHIVAYLTGRNEREIVVHPDAIRVRPIRLVKNFATVAK